MNETVSAVINSLSIALLALSLWLMSNRRLRLGLIFGILGLAGVSAASMWRYLLLTRVAALTDDVTQAQNHIAARDEQLTANERAWGAQIATIWSEATRLESRLRVSCNYGTPVLDQFEGLNASAGQSSERAEAIVRKLQNIGTLPCLSVPDVNWLRRTNQVLDAWVTAPSSGAWQYFQRGN